MNDAEFNIELTPAIKPKAVLSEAGASAPREAIWKIPFDKLVILEDFNVRSHDSKWEERVDALAEDMAENGYRPTKPMEIFVDSQGRFIVADGHTRHAGLTRAHEKYPDKKENLWMIPAIPSPAGTTMEDLTIGLFKSNNGEKLTPLDLSKVVGRLVKNYDNNASEAARKLGITPKYSTQLLMLHTAPFPLKKMVEEGKVSATLAIQTIEEHGGEEALRILQEGMEQAEKVGKKKVTKKHTETSSEDKLAKAQKKFAPTMHQLIQLLMEPDSDAQVPKGLAEKFEQLLEQIDIEATGE